MKKPISLLLTFTLCIGMGVLVGCAKSVEALVGNCSTTTQKFSDALIAYSNTPTDKTKCQAYKDATQDFINSTCYAVYGTAADRKSIQDDLNKTTCK